MSPNVLCPAPPCPVVPDHLIVAQDHAEWCQALREAFAARGNFTVIVDGRYAERRQRAQAVLEERQPDERRSCPALTADPRR